MGHVNTGPSIQDLELFEYQRGGYSMADPMTLLQQQLNGAMQGATSVQSPQIVQMPVPPINPIPQQAPQVQNVAENIPVPPVTPSIVQKQVNPEPTSVQQSQSISVQPVQAPAGATINVVPPVAARPVIMNPALQNVQIPMMTNPAMSMSQPQPIPNPQMVQNVAPSVPPVQNVAEQSQQANPEPVKEQVQQTVPSEEALSNEGQNAIAKEHPVFAPDPAKLVESEPIKTAEEQRGAVPIATTEIHEVTAEDQQKIVQQNAAAFTVGPGTEVKNLKSQSDVNNLARQLGEQKQEEMKMSNDKKRFVEAISEYVNSISDEEFKELSNDFEEGKNAGSFKKFWKKWGNKILIATGVGVAAGVGYKVITSRSGSSDDIDEEDAEELVSCLSALFA